MPNSDIEHAQVEDRVNESVASLVALGGNQVFQNCVEMKASPGADILQQLKTKDFVLYGILGGRISDR